MSLGTDVSARPVGLRSSLGLVMLVALGVSLAAVWGFHSPTPPFELPNLVGPTTASLLEGRGLTVCTEAIGTPGNPICYHAGRMPFASVVVAAGVYLFGNRPFPVGLYKAALLLLPLEAALWLALRRCSRLGAYGTWIAAALLLAPVGITAFLADVVNLQVEEGYSYSVLALALAILLFAFDPGATGPRSAPSPEARARLHGGWRRALLFAAAVDGVYLAKSSMAPAVIVLLAGYLLLERRTSQRLVVLGLVLLAPLGWALHQWHASGRLSVGTSLDGINLHKSNSPQFLRLYPPVPGTSLDGHDAELSRGMNFRDEWSFHDYHRREALAFIRSHPADVLRGDLRKLDVMFVSWRKIGSTESQGRLRVWEVAGTVLFRILLWASILGSLYVVVRQWSAREAGGASLRRSGLIYLGLVGGVALPYLVGFAYTRHISVLIYPSSLMCCRLLQGDKA